MDEMDPERFPAKLIFFMTTPSSPSRPNYSFRLIPFLGWTLAFWAAAAATIFSFFVMYPNTHLGWWGGATLVMMAAVIFAKEAVSATQGGPRALRVAFWMLTLPVLTLGGFVLYAQLDLIQSRHDAYQGWLMIFTGLATALVAAALGWRAWRSKGNAESSRGEGGSRFWWVADLGLGLLCLFLLVGGSYFIFDKIYVAHQLRVAEQKWAEIGHPMPEFEKQALAPVQENESLRKLVEELEPLGIVSFYKRMVEEDEPNPEFNFPMGVITIFEKSAPHSDSFELVNPAETGTDQPLSSFPKNSPDVRAGIAYLTEHAQDLERIYDGILRRDPPVWALSFGPDLRPPNYLAARKLAQLIRADADFKAQRGDFAGAQKAISAGMRMSRNLGEEPLLVSYLIYTAIDALLHSGAVRLPENPEDLKAMPAYVKQQREQLCKPIQAEAWWVLGRARAGDYLMLYSPDFLPPNLKGWPVSESLLKKALGPWIKLSCARSCQFLAEAYKINERSAELSGADLGVGEIDRRWERIASFLDCTPNLRRVILRVNFSLLLREQTALIQAARAQMKAGQSGVLAQWPSAMAAGSKWIVTGDAATRSVTTKLEPMPKWAAGREVVDEVFFPILPDGTTAWKF
jgi:hypothetical protein